ncbi:uncharacterized protein LOC115222216 [Octopus sinensis]|uniref:Uncharacterized protein LOC115222216 n=1 Tax=Octopus sinensis TaxID=2607531 RepID=A0A6P7TEP4_9MOLL|nr:uncharacterized protein LOC115222216 [Octopus sinensis]XP_036367056.1 uncharacterized protein LOC115222216 [Octopus sinensis]XP_036367057.1 uncharacterized protein LOC115222216 [Octopus sinensis]XP_036367058.1 uncharacterized protein LOC115222216 [Octopus sinensis]XP_036367059.1 uncharacterized protein LOC115222216 [Octopus sinensis]
MMENEFCGTENISVFEGLEKLQNNQIPLLFSAGTHYDVSYTIGGQFSKQITSFCAQFPELKSSLLPYYNCHEGRSVYEGFLASCNAAFPQYVEEIKGMSDGSGVAFENLFLLNCLNEMLILSKKSTNLDDTRGCTSVFINRPDLKILAHNEDYSPRMEAYVYIACCKIDDNFVKKNVVQEDREYITAYCYPGFLPGGNFSFNNHGMIFACNGLYPAETYRECIPRRFIDRSLLSASSVTQAVKILEDNKHGVAYGICCNMASVKDKDNMWALEVGPKHQHYLHTIPPQNDPSKDCHYIHVNTYQHLNIEELPAVAYGSSAHRYKHASSLPPPRSAFDICNILGDTDCKEYPIYRTPRPTDRSQTLATAVFNILENKVDIHLKNTKDDKAPAFSLPLNFI